MPDSRAFCRADGLMDKLSGMGIATGLAGSSATIAGAASSPPATSKLESTGLKAAMTASISAALASPPSLKTASNAPTGQVSPAFATIRTNRPGASASTSLVILSVSISVSVVPRSNGAFSATIHSAIVPSLISMPHLGMVKGLSIAIILPFIGKRGRSGLHPRSSGPVARAGW